MSSVFLTKGGRPLVKVTDISRNEGGTTRTSGIQELIAAAVDVQTNHIIPHELVTGLVDNLNHKGNVHGGVLGPNSQLTKLATAQIAEQVRVVPGIHFAYYKALLNSMQDVLNSPGIAAKSTGAVSAIQARRGRPNKQLRNQVAVNRAVTLNLSRAGSYRLSNKTLSLHAGTSNGAWMPLRRSTVRDKRAGPKEGQVFWRHTGRLSRAFTTARRAQLSGLLEDDFLGPVQTPQFIDSERKRLSKGVFASEVKLQIRVGIPRWRNPAENYMDTIVTDAFAGDKPGALGGFFRANDINRDGNLRTALERLQHLRDKNPGKRKEGNFYKLFLVDQKEKGLRRILAPEFRRPWLRNLSSITNKAMRNELRSLFR